MRDLLRTNRNPVFGMLIAPAAPLFALIIVNLILAGQFTDPLQAAHLIFPFSYPISLVVGTPILYIFKILNKRQIWHYIVAGALASTVPIFIMLIYPLVQYSSPFTKWTSLHSTIAVMMAASGVIVATTFWAVTRPDLANKA